MKTFRHWSLMTMLFCLLFCRETAAESFRFALITDIHIGPGSLENIKRLEKVIADINSRKDILFTVVTGDLSNSGTSAELDITARMLKNLTMPCHVIPGNHDTNWSDSAALHFRNLFMSERFSVEYKGVGCIGISTGPYMKMGDGFVRSEDLNYVRSELKKFSQARKPVILFTHYPVSGGLSAAVPLGRLLTSPEHRVLGVVCGHYHRTFLQKINHLDHFVGGALRSYTNQTLYHILTCSEDGRLSAVEKNLTTGKERPFPVVDDILYHEREIPDIAPGADFSIRKIFSAGASVYTGAASDGGERLLLGTSSGEVILLNTEGKELWRKKMSRGSIYSNPLFLNENLGVVGTIEKEILYFSLNDGSVVRKIGPLPAEITCNGLVSRKLLYIGGGQKEFHCLNAAGEKVWSAQGFGLMQARPAMNNRALFFGAWDRYLYALDRKSGKLLWRWTNGSPQVLFSPGNVIPAVTGRQVVIVAPDRYMTALDADTGLQLWRTKANKVREALGISEDRRRIYAKTMDGYMIAVQADRPECIVLWKTDLGFGYEHAPCNILERKGLVYCGNRKGHVVAVNPQNGTLLWRKKAGETAVNFFTSDSKGKVFFSLIEGTVFSIERKD